MAVAKILEEQLKAAMLTSDLTALENLLAPDLIFTNHLGQVVSKAQDIELHRSGLLKITGMETLEELISAHNTSIVVSVLLRLSGSYAGSDASGLFRFTRVWALNAELQWQVIAAHSSLIT